MSYRPLTDFWFLARCKYKNGIKRYGGYLGGFPERARVLIGAPLDEPVLHVCGGMARHYPYARGFGPADRTQDLDPACSPDFLFDASVAIQHNSDVPWAGILIDPPYSEEAADDCRVWIDMETRVRSDDDRVFDLDKVVKCLEISKPFIEQ